MSELQRDFADIHGNRLNMFIGPEGGFSPAEIALFKTSRIPVFSIGEQVLRAETAAIAAASIFLLSY
jgi:16S rRNA (uracil1498-N3)-methyltransferase